MIGFCGTHCQVPRGSETTVASASAAARQPGGSNRSLLQLRICILLLGCPPCTHAGMRGLVHRGSHHVPIAAAGGHRHVVSGAHAAGMLLCSHLVLLLLQQRMRWIRMRWKVRTPPAWGTRRTMTRCTSWSLSRCAACGGLPTVPAAELCGRLHKRSQASQSLPTSGSSGRLTACSCKFVEWGGSFIASRPH